MDQLFKEIAHFGWSLGTLKLWSKADFRCVYCDLNMFASLDNNQLGVLDHLLPQSRYPLLKVSPSNLVLSCWVCNRIKRHWDANTKVATPVYHDGDVLEPAQRKELITRARRYIESMRKKKEEALKTQLEAINTFRLRRPRDGGDNFGF